MNRDSRIIECRRQALLLLANHAAQAAVGGYYLPLFTWLYRELEQGRRPSGIPRGLLEWWSKPVDINDKVVAK